MIQGSASHSGAVSPAPQAVEVPRGQYGALTAVGVVLGVGVAFGGVFAFKGGMAEAQAAAMCFAVASVVGFAPALMRISAEYWGLVVLISGMVRGGICYAAASMALNNNPELVRRPLFLAVMAAALLNLVLESAAAVRILSDLDRKKAAMRRDSQNSTTAHGHTPASMEHV